MADFAKTLRWIKARAGAVGVTVHLRQMWKNAVQDLNSLIAFVQTAQLDIPVAPATALSASYSASTFANLVAKYAETVFVALPEEDLFGDLYGDNGALSGAGVSAQSLANIEALVKSACNATPLGCLHNFGGYERARARTCVCVCVCVCVTTTMMMMMMTMMTMMTTVSTISTTVTTTTTTTMTTTMTTTITMTMTTTMMMMMMTMMTMMTTVSTISTTVTTTTTTTMTTTMTTTIMMTMTTTMV
jgi:hypothetical protein